MLNQNQINGFERLSQLRADTQPANGLEIRRPLLEAGASSPDLDMG